MSIRRTEGSFGMQEDSNARRERLEDFPVEMLVVGWISVIAALVLLAHPNITDAWRAVIVICAWFAGALVGWKGASAWDALMHGLPPVFPNATTPYGLPRHASLEAELAALTAPSPANDYCGR
jgi:hypothetical protein